MNKAVIGYRWLQSFQLHNYLYIIWSFEPDQKIHFVHRHPVIGCIWLQSFQLQNYLCMIWSFEPDQTVIIGHRHPVIGYRLAQGILIYELSIAELSVVVYQVTSNWLRFYRLVETTAEVYITVRESEASQLTEEHFFSRNRWAQNRTQLSLRFCSVDSRCGIPHVFLLLHEWVRPPKPRWTNLEKAMTGLYTSAGCFHRCCLQSTVITASLCGSVGPIGVGVDNHLQILAHLPWCESSSCSSCFSPASWLLGRLFWVEGLVESLDHRVSFVGCLRPLILSSSPAIWLVGASPTRTLYRFISSYVHCCLSGPGQEIAQLERSV